MDMFDYISQATGGMSDLLIWLGVCAAAFLAVFGLVVFSVLRRRRQKENDVSA